jgi:hypothetical protein
MLGVWLKGVMSLTVQVARNDFMSRSSENINGGAENSQVPKFDTVLDPVAKRSGW